MIAFISAPSGSALASLASALYLNNETINIHSHLAGGFVFALLPIYFHLAFDPPLADAIVVTIFLEGVAICFLLSALQVPSSPATEFVCCLTLTGRTDRFHTFENHSPSVSSFFHHLDHLGIVILMWGAGISMIHYGFLCDARLRTTYWTLMFCAAVTLLPKFRTPEYHSWKVAIYTSLGLTGLVFIIHGLVVFGWETQNRRMPFLWMAGMAVANLIGALIFVTRVGSIPVGPSYPNTKFAEFLADFRAVVLAQVRSLGLQPSGPPYCRRSGRLFALCDPGQGVDVHAERVLCYIV